jgi:DNA polymerase I-like protein with 3'-5' exonuclease and polymerase domains
MITTVDVETSYQKTEAGGFDPSPFNPDNILVSVGINDEYYFTNHSERVDEGCHAKIQKILDETKLLIGHNIKFDLSWLLEAGFTYTGNVYDTMIAEYVLNRGVRKSLTLLMCCQRRKLDAKDDAVKEYMDRGVSFENIPAEIVEQYGRVDVSITRQLFDSQMVDLRSDKDKGLLKTIKVMNEFLIVLTDMERNGINVNLDDLKEVEKEYRAEFAYLKQKIDKIVYEKMGDTKINLGSPEQLSWLIYSKKPKDKNQWAKIFNTGVDKFTKKNKKRPKFSFAQFRTLIANNSEPIYRTIASQCKWHEELQSQAITFKRIKLPTGREYSFPYAERMPWGGSSYATQIKNYPVQGFATADIVPLACIKIYKLMNEQRVKSLLINTVHDSIVADVYPGEEAVMSKIFDQGTASVIPALKEYYGINFNVPLDTEIKMGYDWLNMKEINNVRD